MMTDTAPDTGMGPEAPATAVSSTRRTRRLAIVGALALVLVAGAVLVGVKTTGARSGSLTSTAVREPIGLKCVWGEFMGSELLGVQWTTNDGSSHRVYYKSGAQEYTVEATTIGSIVTTDGYRGRDYYVSWGSANNAADTKYDFITC